MSRSHAANYIGRMSSHGSPPGSRGIAGTGYPVPAATRRSEETVRRSRFITTLDRADSAEAARDRIALIRDEFPDATHHCWAYAAGPPGDSRCIGLSDDGEPHGTAGKPMLNVLLHSGIGEVVAVCTRYFGGVKLGTGGLSRAYAGGVIRALDGLPTIIKQELIALEVRVSYEQADAVQRLAQEHDVVIERVEYAATVRLLVLAPIDKHTRFSEGVRRITRGKVVPTPRQDPGR